MDITAVGAYIQIRFDLVSAWLESRGAVGDEGASLVEYALLVALIAVLCIGALRFLSDKVSTSFSNVGSSVN
jgi:pilus assembly protein Flp/PilA